ncbi:MAG: PmoA family protein [Niabella sp.]
MKNIIVIFSSFFIPFVACAQSGLSISQQPQKKQVDILYDGKLLTAYCYYDSVAKPVLFPVNTIDGITVTRGYPLAPRPGERTDHPHHIGIWMNYESVNGIDFWNNSTAIPADKKDLYGTIKHDKIVTSGAAGNTAFLTATAGWFNNKGDQYLKEKSTYQFKVEKGVFIIDRITTLTALDQQVIFKDVKDGFFAIRVARELEMPSKEPGIFVDAHGNQTRVDATNGKEVTGMYYNSMGTTGDSVWSSKAPWAMLKGTKEGKPITIAMFDHPNNIGYPTYWHARGYGLFALNPLGRKVFSNGKEALNFTLQPHQSAKFIYRIIIASKDLNNNEISKISHAFEKLKY